MSHIQNKFTTDPALQQRPAETQLREKSILLQNITDHMLDMVAITDLDGVFSYAGPSHRTLGFEPEQIVGTSVFDYVHPEDAEYISNEFAGFMADPTPSSARTVEYRQRCADGSYLWLETKGKFLFDDNGTPCSLFFSSRDITERKQAEQALRNSEEKYRTLFETAPVGIFQTTPQGRFISVNLEYARIVGYSSPSEMIKQVADIAAQLYVRPEEREHYKEMLQRDGQVKNFVAELKHLDGSTFWVSMSAKTLRNPDGSIVYDGFLVDISDRKRAEDALRESEMHLQQVFDILPVGLWFADKEGTLLRGNPAGIKIWGAEPLVDPARYDVFKARRFPSGEEIAPTDWSLYHTIRNKATIVDELLEIDAFDGKTKIILNSTAPVLDEQGDVQGAIVVNRDITERIRAEADLKRIEWMLSKKPPSASELHAEVHDQGYGDLTALNREGAIIKLIGPELLQSFANDYMDLLGTSSAIYEVNGDYAMGIFASGWCRLMDRASRELCDTSDNVKALQSGKWLCHESCWTCCSKEAIAQRSPMDIACHGGIRLYGVPILVGGEVAGVINFGYGDPPKDPVRLRQLAKDYHLDYDDLVREARAYDSRPPYIIEMAKSRLHATARLIGSILEAKLSEQARQKLQDQLNQARKMESIGRLAGGVAHDYNNMLSVIIGYTEMALDKLPPHDPLHADFTEIYKAAKRSSDITNQLLAFARKQTIDPQVVDLNALVESMLRMLRRLIGEDIDLNWHPGKRLWPVKMDPAQVDQILVNLCVNARDAIGGVGRVTIETGNIRLDEDYAQSQIDCYAGDFVMLVVSDDGCGMDQKVLDNIFEPFFTTKGISEGTGLGLPTVYGIVKQNEGFVNVYSEPGKGTTFRLYLPKHAGTQSQPPLTARTPTPNGRGETVLLVEDEPSILHMGEIMLNRLGYHVLAAGTPNQAIELASASKGQIDLLITDVVMPEMNGRQLSEQLNDLFPGTRTLFMSGYTADVIAHRGVLDEGMHFIQKPFSLHDLGIKVRTVLEDN